MQYPARKGVLGLLKVNPKQLETGKGRLVLGFPIHYYYSKGLRLLGFQTFLASVEFHTIPDLSAQTVAAQPCPAKI